MVSVNVSPRLLGEDGFLAQINGLLTERSFPARLLRLELTENALIDSSTRTVALLGELRRGVGEGQLRVHYQPQVRLSDGALTGVEALVRWQHPTRGLLPPAAFIEVAEQSGLVRELGTWVLDAAVAQAARRDGVARR